MKHIFAFLAMLLSFMPKRKSHMISLDRTPMAIVNNGTIQTIWLPRNEPRGPPVDKS